MNKQTRTKGITTKRIAVFLGIICMISTMMACIEQRDNDQEPSSNIASVTEDATPLPSQKGDSTDAATLSPTGKPNSVSTPSPVAEPTEVLVPSPTEEPTETPLPSPTEKPTEAPVPSPTEEPTKAPTPTEEPAVIPSEKPTSGFGNSNFNTYDNPEQENTEDTWVLNTNSKKIHYPSCSSVKKIAPKNYSTSNESLETLKSRGFTTCGNCFK